MKTAIKIFGISALSILGFFLGASAVSAQAVVGSCTSATISGTVTPNGNSTTAWFEWGTNQSTVLSGGGTRTVSQSFSTNSTFTQVLSGLTPNTNYYYRAMAQNTAGTATGSILSFSTPSCGGTTGTLPTVTINADQTNIQYNNATYIHWYPSNATSCTTTGGSGGWTGVGSASSGTFYTGPLTQTTTYGITCANSTGSASASVIVYVGGQQGVGCGYYGNCGYYGGQLTVSTISATSIGQNNATLNGIVNGNGYSTMAWFEWGTSYSFGNTTSQNSAGTGSMSYNTYLSGLASNTTYYYRAVAQSSQGIVYGNTISFTTMGGGTYPNIGYNAGVGSAPTAVTTLATQISNSTAQLNSLILTSASVSSNAWFEWGTNAGLGNTTPSVQVGSLPSIRHSDTITGLVRGNTYYYRVVAENSYGKSYGLVQSFVADGATVRPVDTTVYINQVTPRTTTRTTTIINRGTGVQSLVMLTVDGGSETILPGESRSYRIEWKNESNQDLKKVVLRVLLPASVAFKSADSGVFTPADNTLTLDIKSLDAGESGDLTLTGTVNNKVPEGELVVVVANLVYTTPSNIQGDALAYATHKALRAQSLVGANVFGAGSFLPTTLFGWISLFALMLLLILLAEMLYGRFAGKPKPKK
ncbi:MAG: hypothetical protein AAB628_03005 [Patescibacteria group bacterium]